MKKYTYGEWLQVYKYGQIARENARRERDYFNNKEWEKDYYQDEEGDFYDKETGEFADLPLMFDLEFDRYNYPDWVINAANKEGITNPDYHEPGPYDFDW